MEYEQQVLDANNMVGPNLTISRREILSDGSCGRAADDSRGGQVV